MAYHLVFDAVRRGRDLAEGDLWYSRCSRVGGGSRSSTSSSASTACGEGAAEEEVLARARSRGGIYNSEAQVLAGRRALEEAGGQHRWEGGSKSAVSSTIPGGRPYDLFCFVCYI